MVSTTAAGTSVSIALRYHQCGSKLHPNFTLLRYKTHRAHLLWYRLDHQLQPNQNGTCPRLLTYQKNTIKLINQLIQLIKSLRCSCQGRLKTMFYLICSELSACNYLCRISLLALRTPIHGSNYKTLLFYNLNRYFRHSDRVFLNDNNREITAPLCCGYR